MRHRVLRVLCTVVCWASYLPRGGLPPRPGLVATDAALTPIPQGGPERGGDRTLPSAFLGNLRHSPHPLGTPSPPSPGPGNPEPLNFVFRAHSLGTLYFVFFYPETTRRIPGFFLFFFFFTFLRRPGVGHLSHLSPLGEGSMGPAMVLAPREEEAGRHTALPNSSGAPPGLRVGTTNQPGLSSQAELSGKMERCDRVS